MSAALASEGENLTKLEKADVLELTVRHLHQLHREGELTVAAAATGLFGAPLHAQRPTAFAGVAGVATPSMERHRYQGGFMACAQHVISTPTLSTIPINLINSVLINCNRWRRMS